MAGFYSVEELVIDDSFRSYCLQENEADMLKWKEYLQQNPSETENVEMAKQLVLGIGLMLKQEYGRPEIMIPLETHDPVPAKTSPVRKMFRYAAAVAAVLVIFFVGRQLMYAVNLHPEADKNLAANTNQPATNQFKTLNGEKKLFILPDSSKVWLNAGSELHIEDGFGINNRQVSLVGEALFDVTHNADMPFIVHIQKYDIKVLGTLFNVKAYPGDKLSETSLVRGKVEISMANSERKILLAPNQKVVIKNQDNPSNATANNSDNDSPVLRPLSLSTRDNAIIETAWSNNRLEIVDESFADIKEKLERWFNVNLTFKDAAVANYHFSATFENENIEQVLNALENAYQFKYEINGNEIILSK